jgi:hypothetical protein
VAFTSGVFDRAHYLGEKMNDVHYIGGTYGPFGSAPAAPLRARISGALPNANFGDRFDGESSLERKTDST